MLIFLSIKKPFWKYCFFFSLSLSIYWLLVYISFFRWYSFFWFRLSKLVLIHAYKPIERNSQTSSRTRLKLNIALKRKAKKKVSMSLISIPMHSLILIPFDSIWNEKKRITQLWIAGHSFQFKFHVNEDFKATATHFGIHAHTNTHTQKKKLNAHFKSMPFTSLTVRSQIKYLKNKYEKMWLNWTTKKRKYSKKETKIQSQANKPMNLLFDFSCA